MERVAAAMISHTKGYGKSNDDDEEEGEPQKGHRECELDQGRVGRLRVARKKAGDLKRSTEEIKDTTDIRRARTNEGEGGKRAHENRERAQRTTKGRSESEAEEEWPGNEQSNANEAVDKEG